MQQKLSDSGLLKQQAFIGGSGSQPTAACWRCVPRRMAAGLYHRSALFEPRPRPTRRLTQMEAELWRDSLAVLLSESDDKHSPDLLGQVWCTERGVAHAA
jgi:hypothetical protein